MGNGELLDSMISDGLWCAFDAVHMGAGTERYTAELGGITREMQDDARGEEPRARRRRGEGRPARRDRADRDPAAARRPGARRHRRGRAPGHHRRVAGQAARRVRGRRHHHRRQRVADLRRRRRRRRDESSKGRGARRARHSPSSCRSAWSPGPTRRCSRSRRARSAVRSTRPTSTVGDLDLFELNEAFAAVGLASMRDLGITDDDRERQRRRDRARPPHRGVGHARGAHARRRASPPWRRARCRGAVRRRRPGRSRDRPRPRCSATRSVRCRGAADRGRHPAAAVGRRGVARGRRDPSARAGPRRDHLPVACHHRAAVPVLRHHARGGRSAARDTSTAPSC